MLSPIPLVAPTKRAVGEGKVVEMRAFERRIGGRGTILLVAEVVGEL